MALHPAFGPHLAGTTALDARLAFAGTLVQTSAGGARPGILSGPPTLVTGRPDKFVDVAGFTSALSRGAADGVSFNANDGTVQVEVASAPAANSRYDVLWERQRDSVTAQAPDADNQPVFGVTPGNASATPSLANTLAVVPRGALPLASILVPAGATTTNGMTIGQIAPFTAPAGSPVQYRSVADMNADAAQLLVGTDAVVLPTMARYRLGQTSAATPVKTWARLGRNVIGYGMEATGGAIAPSGGLSAVYGSRTFDVLTNGDLHAHVTIWTRGAANGIVGSILFFIDGVQYAADGQRGRIHTHGASGQAVFEADMTVPLAPGSHGVALRIAVDGGTAAIEHWDVTFNYAIHY